MTQYQRLLVCEAMLARLEDALARADEELACASTLEGNLGRRLAHLDVEQKRLERKLTNLKADTPEKADPLTVRQEPTLALQAFEPTSMLRGLKTAQERLMHSLEFHRPSAQVRTVQFGRGPSADRPVRRSSNRFRGGNEEHLVG